MNDDKTTSTMVKIDAKIGVASDGTWGVYCKEQPFTGAGDTPQEAKDDMMEQMQFYKETMKGLGMKYPAFLDSEFEVDYDYDINEILHYYVDSGRLSLAGLEKITGINQKQLWSYLNGTKPRKAQRERIVRGFRAFSEELRSIFP